jgi:hypothetical protein
MTKKIKINCILKFKIEVDLHIPSCLDGKIIIIKLFLLNELFNTKIDHFDYQNHDNQLLFFMCFLDKFLSSLSNFPDLKILKLNIINSWI